MSRSARLLSLLQLLRRHRRPLTGAAIAAELDISLRTLYRDVATLQAQGARIDGAPGLGYLLRPGFELPPLMFSAEELQALALGSRWVAQRGDAPLAAAASDALAKIAAVLPAALRHALDDAALLVGPGRRLTAAASGAAGSGDSAVGGVSGVSDVSDVAAMRQAIRLEHKLAIGYRNAGGDASQRTVWPFALGYFDGCQVLVAWCERRAAVRHFRCDRITALASTGVRYPQRRQSLLQAWRDAEGIAAQ